MGKITEQDLLDLNEKLYELIWTPNKAVANPMASRIRHKAHNFEYDDFKDRDLLFEAITHAESAAGEARRKEYWIRNFESTWFLFESKIMDDLAMSNAREVKEVEI